MPSRTQRSARPGRTAGSVLRGLLALVAIVVLLAGIPLALITVAGNPLPDSVPSWGDVTSALNEPDDGSLFLQALVWVGWLGWASFAIGLLVEIPAALRGRTAPRLPVLRVQQRAAAGLVTAVAALFVVGPVGMATAAEGVQAAAPPVAEDAAAVTPPAAQDAAPAAAQHAAPAAAQDAAPAAPQPVQRTHAVQSGESLWKIAEQELGDGRRWPEIAELNYGRPQPGDRALDSTHWIAPGWQLLLPAEPAAAAPDQADGATTHVVVKGDTLWDIAEKHLGDGARYPELFEASRHTVQPDGRQLRDPDLIYPGWTITVPVAQQPPADEPPIEDEPPVEDEPPIEDEPVEEEPPVEDQPPIEEQPPVEDEDSQVGTPQEQSTGDADEGFPVRTAAGVGSLLAAGVLAYLAAKRRTQQRRRQPGERIAMPDGAVAATEHELRGVADPMSVEIVDLALRGLAASCARRGVALPPVRIARLTAEQFELYLTEAAELPSPFVPTEQEHVWFLPVDAGHAFDPVELQGVTAPYPSLVTIGHGPEDGHLLLDLERLGTLALVGEPPLSQQVMAALAVELATSPWADDLQVTLVGTCPELAEGLDTGRIRYLPSVGTLLDELSRRAGSDRAALAESGAYSLDDARAKGVAAAAWTPEIVLLAQALSHEQNEHLTELVDALPRVAVAAVTSGDDAVGEWSLELNSADPDVAVLQPVGVEVNPQRLDERQYGQILELLGITEQPGSRLWTGGTADPDVSRLPDLSSHEPDEPGVLERLESLEAEFADIDPIEVDPVPIETAGAAHSTFESVAPEHSPAEPVAAEPSVGGGPTILLLGPVEVEDADGPVEQSKYRQLTEIAAYVALHPGLDHSALDEAIWPGNRVTQNTRNTAVSKLRRWFGRDENGEDYLPRVDSGYRFHPGVTTDWDRWTAWVGDDPRTVGTQQLVAALELVRGQPFTGVNPRRYAWAEHLKQEMISTIVDAAHELAQRALKSGDAHLARKAATIGLQVEPGMELLWRDRIKAEHVAGNRAGIDDAVARLTAISADLGDDLEDATIRLIDQLVPSGQSARI